MLSPENVLGQLAIARYSPITCIGANYHGAW